MDLRARLVGVTKEMGHVGPILPYLMKHSRVHIVEDHGLVEAGKLVLKIVILLNGFVLQLLLKITQLGAVDTNPEITEINRDYKW